MGKESVLSKVKKKISSEIAGELRNIAVRIGDGAIKLKKGSTEIETELSPNMLFELKLRKNPASNTRNR